MNKPRFTNPSGEKYVDYIHLYDKEIHFEFQRWDIKDLDKLLNYLIDVKKYLEEQNKPRVGDYGKYQGISYIVCGKTNSLVFIPIHRGTGPTFNYPKDTIQDKYWKKEGNIFK